MAEMGRSAWVKLSQAEAAAFEHNLGGVEITAELALLHASDVCTRASLSATRLSLGSTPLGKLVDMTCEMQVTGTPDLVVFKCLGQTCLFGAACETAARDFQRLAANLLASPEQPDA